MGTKNLGSGNDYFRAHKEGGFLGIGDEWRSWTINGNDGNDTLIGGEKSDTIHGGNHNDSIYGMGGTDTLYGDAGDDTIGDASGQRDYMNGGTGNDTYSIDVNDVVTEFANEGYDRIFVQNNTAVAYTMPNQVEALYAGTGIATVFGNNLDNVIIATYETIGSTVIFNQLDNVLSGNGGYDIIFAGEGKDILSGGDQDDVLGGDNGNDKLFGDAGHDSLIGAQYADYGIRDGAGNYYPTNKANLGKGEIDTLTGGAGNDSFTLGMSNLVFYDDRTVGTGAQDYALISDFVIGQDKIILNGSASNYLLSTGSYNLGSSAQETFIYRKKTGEAHELIGIVQDVTGLSLTNTNQFAYA